MGNVSKQDLEALIEIFDRSDWQLLRVELSGLTIELSKRSVASSDASPSKDLSDPRQPGSLASPMEGTPQKTVGSSATREPQVPDGWVVVRAPNLGTFYRAPKPGVSPYVEIGQEVQPQTEVCLIEVMKLFTTVSAGVHGIVRRICASDGDVVEYNRALFVIEPTH